MRGFTHVVWHLKVIISYELRKLRESFVLYNYLFLFFLVFQKRILLFD